ncbi:hypothetical protein NX059_005860 [Plenodomus lindquistii]|nr:hypothetical protein NX059_005860 [Plenodomus lindquistii]
MPAVLDPYDAHLAAQIENMVAVTPRNPSHAAPIYNAQPQPQPHAKRQQMLIQQGIIPTYYNLSGPTPGTVVGIVLGSVAGFLLIVWLLYSLTNGAARTRGTTTAMAGEEEIVVRRRRNSHGNTSRARSSRQMREVSRSPRRNSGRSQVLVDERRPVTRTRSVLVEERRRVPGDDVVEVIEESDDYRERRGNRRSGGYR